VMVDIASLTFYDAASERQGIAGREPTPLAEAQA